MNGGPLACSDVVERDLMKRYIDEALSTEEAESFERHYFGCDRCWEDLQTAIEADAALRRARPSARAPRQLALLSLAAALLIAGVSAVLFLHRAGEGGPMADMIRASEGPRRVLGRLGEFPYGAAPSISRGAATEVPERTRAAAHRALGIEASRASVPARHAAGVAHLLLGENDPAIQELEAAARQSPNDALLQNDLAAAYYERFRSSDAREDREKALTAVEAALRSNPAFAPALFNRALIVESAQVPGEALKAWQAFLAAEPKGSWADEARRHVELLSRGAAKRKWGPVRDELERSPERFDAASLETLAKEFPQELRFWIGDRALPAWSNAVIAGRRDEASARLGLVAGAAGAWARRTGDSLLSDTVRQIGDGAARSAPVAAGFSAYGRARAQYSASALAEALDSMRTAGEALSRAKSPFAPVAELYEVAFLSLSGNGAGARQRFGRISFADDSISLSAFRNWVDALMLSAEGRFEEALKRDLVALNLYERLGESENVASAHSQVAEFLSDLGQRDTSWHHREAALQAMEEKPDAFRLHPILSEAAREASAEELPRTARLWLDALIGRARRQGEDALAVEAYAWRVSALDRLDPLRSRTELREAHSLAARISDANARRMAEAELDLAEGEVLETREPAEAVRLLDGLIPVFEDGKRTRLLACYLARARALRALGRTAEAEAELRRGVELFERERELVDAANRTEFFEKAQAMFDETIGLLVDQGRGADAFAVSERARSRSLTDASANRPGLHGPLALGDVGRLLPRDLEVIEYAVLPDRLVVWEVTRDRQSARTIPVHETEIVAAVLRLSPPSGPGSEIDRRAAAASLGNLLLGGRARELPRIVVFVPDKVLWRVAFPELRAPNLDAPLFEGSTVAVAPSATFFLGTRREPAPSDRGPTLIIGAPGADSALRLPNLPHVEDEARLIATLVPRPRLLLGGEATRSRFLELGPDSSLIHFAGHAVVRPAPSASSLRLAGQGGTTEALYLPEIARASFSRTRLVVLSGCSTASGTIRGREGALSFCRAFLEAGVPAAIGTLWAIEDSTAQAVFSRFYSRLRDAAPPALALRDAQHEHWQATHETTSMGGLQILCAIEGVTGFPPAQKEGT